MFTVNQRCYRNVLLFKHTRICLFLLDSARSHFKDDVLVAEISERRALAKDPEKLEKTRDDFFDLIDKLDKYNEFKERQEQTEHSAGRLGTGVRLVGVVYCH